MPILNWNAAIILDQTQAVVTARMAQVVSEMAADAKKSVSRPNPGGRDPSLPGEPPKRVTGNLEEHIGFEVASDPRLVRGRFGVRDRKAVPYAMRLEFGFVGIDSRGRHYNQAPRPFLRPAFLRLKARALQILRGGAL
ncbi:hypothetical protein IMX07_10930 [bacterium]|nr:hypothetical protein [bacterium]